MKLSAREYLSCPFVQRRRQQSILTIFLFKSLRKHFKIKVFKLFPFVFGKTFSSFSEAQEGEKNGREKIINKLFFPFRFSFSSFSRTRKTEGNLWSPRVSLSSLLFVLIFLCLFDDSWHNFRELFFVREKLFSSRPVGKDLRKFCRAFFLWCLNCRFRNYTEMKISLPFLGGWTGDWRVWGVLSKAKKGARDSRQ